MILENQLDSYKAFDGLKRNPEALNALLKGVAKYDEFYEQAKQYGVEGKYDSMLEEITASLNDKFGVSIDSAREINALKTQEEYSEKVYSIAK
jgi:hypothetical protein